LGPDCCASSARRFFSAAKKETRNKYGKIVSAHFPKLQNAKKIEDNKI